MPGADLSNHLPVPVPVPARRAGPRRLMARRPWLVVAAAAVLGFSGSAVVALLLGIPVPSVHDEFSYLLAADTFARGRLTNPPHSDWTHFETFHVIQQPTYASKYPPAQGMLLALGMRTGGHAVVGLWLGSAFMCAAITWMLQAWLPSRWAAIGGGLAFIQWGLVGHWSQDYFGGAVAAGGGAMLFGAMRRLVKRPRWATSLVLGAGLAILANSRPWEGLLISVLPMAVLLARLVGAPSVLRSALVSLGPALLLLLLAAAAMMRYNHAVTGEPLRLPYLEHEAQYAVHPLFLWQQPRIEPEYRHERIRRLHVEWELGRYKSQQTLSGYAQAQVNKLAAMAWRFLGPVLWLPALASVLLMRRGWILMAAAGVAAMVVATFNSTFYASHYVAPMAGAVIYLVVVGMRVLRAWVRSRGAPWRRFTPNRFTPGRFKPGRFKPGRFKPGRFKPGRFTPRLITPLVMILSSAALIPQVVQHVRHNRRGDNWGVARQDLERRLSANPGRHLVLVSYEDGFPLTMEWVYNSAGIDEQPVVWAHDLGRPRNQKLLEHFADRTVWRLTAGAVEIRLERVAGPARELPGQDRFAPPSNPG